LATASAPFREPDKFPEAEAAVGMRQRDCKHALQSGCEHEICETHRYSVRPDFRTNVLFLGRIALS
jgi:hypothetical protein